MKHKGLILVAASGSIQYAYKYYISKLQWF